MQELFDLSCEIAGISAMICGLSNQLDENETDTLTPATMENALYGVRCHLDRISSDLEELSKSRSKEEKIIYE